jgi:hypothetical protein
MGDGQPRLLDQVRDRIQSEALQHPSVRGLDVALRVASQQEAPRVTSVRRRSRRS